MTNKSYDDIDETLDYIANKKSNVKAAKKLYDLIYVKIEKICNDEIYSKDCRKYSIVDETIRRVNVKNYILIFKIDAENNLIVILRFLYKMRDISSILSDIETDT